MMRPEMPERSVSLIYEDDRWTPRFAMNVRYRNTLEVLRFHSRREAQAARGQFHQKGFKLLSR